ncbi:alpha/beta hydrolase [Paenibacillus sp. FSL H7-0326]|uniref:alpha/beta hydrolase n=1 Tax=Paenibacillus sp. FSL H7-0326 TaxID=1921144 RepID=UPI0009FB3E31|nr:alpha/beta hydrolase-fold protein [Paenibacillus sp. FSL H7-0326]
MRGKLAKYQLGNRSIYVYTPPSYDENDTDLYPAVIVQDGSYLFVDSMEELEADFASGITQEVLFIGIQPHRRDCEYTPWKAEPLQEGEVFGGEGDRYLDFVTEKVIPFVRERYRITEDTSQIGITGGSLGALISLYAAFQKPDYFGRFIMMSASLWFENFVSYVESSTFTQNDVRLYMYVGETEGVGRDNLQQYMVPNTKKVYRILTDKIPGGADQIMLETDPEGVHSHQYFNKYFPRGMRFAYPGPSVIQRA